MTREQVKQARRRVWGGETISSVADDFELKYGAVWNAVRGYTWRSIVEPPPIPDGHLKGGPRSIKGKPCRNCGEDNRSGSNGLCGKCYRYWYRHGVDRPDNMRHPFYINIPMTEIDELYDRYCNGESIDSLGDEAPFSAETLRRRFREYGLPIRKNTAHNQKFTEATVLQARQLHYEDGWMISEVARYLGIKYQTVYEAVKFTTWSHVGGPGRDEPGDPVPCSCCGVLTGHHSGLCRFCLDEK